MTLLFPVYGRGIKGWHTCAQCRDLGAPSTYFGWLEQQSIASNWGWQRCLQLGIWAEMLTHLLREGFDMQMGYRRLLSLGFVVHWWITVVTLEYQELAVCIWRVWKVPEDCYKSVYGGYVESQQTLISLYMEGLGSASKLLSVCI